VAIYFLRANQKRVFGSLAGGVVYALLNQVRLSTAVSMGWWKSGFADTPDPFDIVPISMLFPITALTGVWALLLSWRIRRRFGWGIHVLFIVGWATISVIRDRTWFGNLMKVMVTGGGTGSLVAEAAFVAAGLVLGHAMMYLIAGPARRDPLARTSANRIP